MAELSKQHAESVTRLSVLSDGSRCYRVSKFTQVITMLSPRHALVTGLGYNSGESAPLITAELERLFVEKQKLTTFVNLAGQTGQASTAREWWGDWVKAHRAQLGVTHMLVRSRIMDMAISVLGMVVGGGMITAHSSIEEFEVMIGEHVPGFRRLPVFNDLPVMLA